jgi:hypothetical protein
VSDLEAFAVACKLVARWRSFVEDTAAIPGTVTPDDGGDLVARVELGSPVDWSEHSRKYAELLADTDEFLVLHPPPPERRTVQA